LVTLLSKELTQDPMLGMVLKNFGKPVKEWWRVFIEYRKHIVYNISYLGLIAKLKDLLKRCLSVCGILNGCHQVEAFGLWELM
tara:strand:- start:303 stop:551 length:249 start_codon:yes stop_codon:yes gene_type:complete